MSGEINPTPNPGKKSETEFRTKARERLLAEHNDLPAAVLQRWITLLNDDGYIDTNTTRAQAARISQLGPTAVWTMMDVRDGSAKVTEARERYFPGQADV